MQARPRKLLRELNERTGLNWSQRTGMILVGEDIQSKLRESHDDEKTLSLMRQLLATSGARARLRLT